MNVNVGSRNVPSAAPAKHVRTGKNLKNFQQALLTMARGSESSYRCSQLFFYLKASSSSQSFIIFSLDFINA
jgi:hypothetical protein